MQFALTAVRGKGIQGGKEINNYLKTLDGNYIVDINPENTQSTPNECRAAYFFKLDLAVQASGNERYDFHNLFKEHLGITSTKNFTVVDWRNFIKQFQIYVFEKLDIVV
ncbi:MAG: hypothetical protein ACEQSQ_06040 [Candidatus Paceibacteria bacterium]